MVSITENKDFVKQMKEFCWPTHMGAISTANLLRMFMHDVFRQTKKAIDGIDSRIGDETPDQRETNFINHQNMFDKDKFDKRILVQDVDDLMRFLSLQVRNKMRKISHKEGGYIDRAYPFDMIAISKEVASEQALYQAFDERAFAGICAATQNMGFE